MKKIIFASILALFVNQGFGQLSCSISVTSNYNGEDISCYGASDGQLTLDISGTNPNYEINWSSLGTDVPAPGTATTTIVESGFSAGTYTVTVTDNLSNTSTCSATVAEPTSVSVTAAGTDPSCGGFDDGEVTVSASGGTGTLTYLWNDAGFQTTQTATSLSPAISGTSYCVTATDANGCMATTCEVISDPTIVIVTSTTTPSSCGQANGSATTTASGGGGAYTYEWSDGQTTATATNLLAGSYGVTATDQYGCTGTGSATVTDPGVPTVSFTTNVKNTVTCDGDNDGFAEITISGGVDPYSLVWSTGTTASGVAASTPVMETGLFGNTTLAVTVTSANGCVFVIDTAIVNPPALTVALINAVSPGCDNDNGVLTANASGGTGALSYDWSPSGGTDVTMTTLSATKHTVEVTDANGCTATDDATLTIPNGPTVRLIIDQHVQCFEASDGEVTATIANGIPPYSYTWSTGTIASGMTAGDYQETGLDTGTVSIVVTDFANCLAANNIVVPQPTQLLTTTVAQTILCNGDSNGIITTTPIGGTAVGNYQYQWANGDTDPTSTGYAAGTHGVTITDDNGCSVTSSGTISDPPLLTTCPPVVSIKDSIFRATLIADITINTNGDDEIDSVEAAVFTGTLDLSGLDISELDGIEAFVSLEYLDVSDNLLIEIDVSRNVSLKQFKCSNNLLKKLDLCANINLNTISTSGNSISSISFIDTTYANANWSTIASKDVLTEYVNDCTVGIQRNHVDPITINAFRNTVVIQGGERTSIFNLMGQQVHQSKLQSGKNMISLDGGIYLVRVTNEGRSVTKKVYLQD